MPQCAVDTCRNSHRRTRKESVCYHRFPHDERVRERWVLACGRKPNANGQVPFNIDTARVCSCHFPVEFYEDESHEQRMQGNQKRNRLRPGAVPIINVPIAVEPAFELFTENTKKRAAQARAKAPKPKRKCLLNGQKQKNSGESSSNSNSSSLASNSSRINNNSRTSNNSRASNISRASNSRTSNSTRISNISRASNSRSSTNSSSGDTIIVKTTNKVPINNGLTEEHILPPNPQEIFLKAVGLIPVNHPCLNKMHAMEGAVENKKKVNTAEDEKPSNSSPSSSKVPQSQQNGAALPEETATAPTTAMSRARIKKDALKKKDSQCNAETPEATKDEQLLASTSRQKIGVTDQRQIKFQSVESLKRRKSTNGQLFAENPRKKLRIDDQREEYILRMVGNDNESVDELMARANQLRSDILALENLQRAKEMEWNDILRKRKLKEEAYTRLERKIRMTVEVENDDQSLPLESSPPHKSSLVLSEWENIGNTTSIASKERSLGSKDDDLVGERPLDSSIQKKEKAAKVITQQRTTPPKTNGESNRKQNEAMSPESRQIGEGRQGAIVDVRSIIADHRLKHPETVPRRGRRMRSSVNIGLGAGGAMVETGHNTDSRPSSTESCKSTPSADSMNYKDMLVQFAKMSQQGEPVKVPQNYPDVTLHPVAPSSAPQNTSSQSSGSSLLHGILTKTQSPRSTTFSPTLARLLTAPERERNSPAAAAAAVASTSQQSATTQHLLQTYQGSNLVSINDLLSSSKARTEITITPVVNTPAHSHSNDLIPVEDVEEETTSNDDRRGSSASGKQVVKDSPSSPNAAPKCQGCIIRPAQFVCAGCGNQWYCSRTCQLAAWSTHSDYCPPEAENGKAKINV